MCDTETRLDGKTAIVTGGSSGVGYETAKNLALRGARVIIASRNETKLTRARDQIQKITNSKLVSHRVIDLASLKSVRNFAANTIDSQEPIDILINNAGAIGLPDRLTEDGLNLTMQVNYFGAFLLTYLLLPLLKNSAPSRIINSSASSMYIGHLDFDHWNDVGMYNSIEVLANSKLAVALFTAELDQRFKDSGVTANSFDPFVVRDTDIFDNFPELVKNISRLFVDMIGQPKQSVGKQIASMAANPDLEMESGQHYKFCKKWINHWLVSDRELTETLWDVSKSVVKITAEEDWELNSVT
ncbi:retinol dehydrogenase 13-like [Pararge aegeria]|uniref:Jg20155 protein n=1 Tax=Pararge aegeria aegeria TaxID=348720 RepID=A0A8S4SJP4_9NEOP|nr:retinol dehydrogenase 13-like [Pararge aegeria]CAH2261538.1 jg20155 [Pararge aegeria aegeria]